ncbi:hypothetical protein [Glycomyces harbinensis]|uniref:Uncharacterized protein n=1 Tax=Glycomyces harbinensis TaxID=58114 RepID=A0A1G7AAE3_9ACTN|nr:hypothetical protein [Glycomyces harbinensis]SDE11751.1 hypothetical protein SAMN05216270_11328 [Glycomyces harbinensis]
MTLLVLGANPCITLYDGDRTTAFASVWRVDWSTHGSGHALVLGTRERIRIIGPDLELAAWLGTEFNRHLTAVRSGIEWREPELTAAPVEFRLDLERGLDVVGDDVSVTIAGPIDRFLTRNDEYDLGGTPMILSTVWIPCAEGSIAVGGGRLPGAPRVDPDGPSSTAFIAEAEVWCTADHPRH